MNPEEERLARWTTCHLSGELLSPPVVADGLGSIFNKEALLQALLDRTLPPGLEHIRGLKSVTELKLELPSESDKGERMWEDWGGVVCGSRGCSFVGIVWFCLSSPTMHPLPPALNSCCTVCVPDHGRSGDWQGPLYLQHGHRLRCE